MNTVIIPVFNAAVNIPNMSSNENVESAGSNVSSTELKNKRPFSALKSVGAWKHRCKIVLELLEILPSVRHRFFLY